MWQQLASATLLVALFALVVWVGDGRRVWRVTVRRWHVSLALAAVALALGLVPLTSLPKYVDIDVLGLIYLMSVVTGFLEVSGAAELAVLRLLTLGGLRVVFGLLLAAGLVSILLENVSVLYLFAPVAMKVAELLGLDPRPLVIGVSLSSNMAGSATMVGDPPAIITAGYLNLSFTDFIFYDGKPSMFFYTLAAMVAACAVATAIIAKWRGRAADGGGVAEEILKAAIDRVFVAEVAVFVAIKIVLLSLRDQLHVPLTLAAGVAVAGITACRILLHRDVESVRRAWGMHDWETPLFLVGVFILTGAFVETGLAARLGEAVLAAAHGSFVAAATLLMLLSVGASAVIDNTPYVAAMLPVVVTVARAAGWDPVPLAWALLVGATLGGNLTFIGASANYAAVKYLSKRGYRVSMRDFARIAVPFTLVSLIVGYGFYLACWH